MAVLNASGRAMVVVLPPCNAAESRVAMDSTDPQPFDSTTIDIHTVDNPSPSYPQRGILWFPTAIVGAATVGGVLYGHGIQDNVWWKGSYTPFHVNVGQDWTYALGADKLGHMVTPFAISRIWSTGLRACGFDSAAAIWTASGFALGYQTYVEIRDGFSAAYGFSPADMVANVVGAGLPIVQHYVPPLRSMTLQISFSPSQAFRDGAYGAIIDDYTSTTHWVSIDMADVVPASWTWYPAWLNVAIGHSVENLDGRGGGNHVVYVSLDWNLARINGLPQWLRDLARVFHLYHLPAPAVRIAPSVAWFGLKF